MVHLNIFVCTGAILLLYLYISNVINMFDVSLWAKRVIYKLICASVRVRVGSFSSNTDSLNLLLKNHMMDSILALFGKLVYQQQRILQLLSFVL